MKNLENLIFFFPKDTFTCKIMNILGLCCRSKLTGEQGQATRGAGRLPELLVGPGPSVNGSRSGTRLGVWVARRAT
jgi:hypothetical protein